MMKYFHAVWSLDGNRYPVLNIDYVNENVDLRFNNTQVPFNEVDIIEVTSNEWLNSPDIVKYSSKVDGDLREDVEWYDDGSRLYRISGEIT